MRGCPGRSEGANTAPRSPAKPSTTIYYRFNQPVLRRPIEPGQYTSIASAETLVLEGIAASIGSIGDAYDNALAETTIGLFKTEAVGRASPFRIGPLRTIDEVECATMEWVDWYNNRRLHSKLNDVPPDEHEAAHYAQT